MQRMLQGAMQQAGIAKKMAEATLVCVAGHPVNKRLPDSDDWACPFLVNCLKSGIADNAKAALLESTWKRWAMSTRRIITGVAGVTGMVTGIGFIVVGGVMSSNPITLPLGVPLAAIGTGITLYSAGASTTYTVITERDHSEDTKTMKRIQDLQPGNNDAQS